MPAPKYSFIDLFSGGGGMSYGFHCHPSFEVIAAFDAEIGKPSSAPGSLGCNDTYSLNMGITPRSVDLSQVTVSDIASFREELLGDRPLDVLSACPPCTGFSRANPSNHLRDDGRNSYVAGVASWVEVLRPAVVVMENARELLTGNFAHHFKRLERSLGEMGYSVKASNHVLTEFGLPQRRERALVVATRLPGGVRTLEDLWQGHHVAPQALTVRRAIDGLPVVSAGERGGTDWYHVAPNMRPAGLERLAAIPHDGGVWLDLRQHPKAEQLLTPAMKRYIAAGKLGSHPDVYGRLWWDRPAITVKRECSHVGNGRYAHPEQDRLLTVREMGVIQGFPSDYLFGGKSLSNMYRHIGDAVPPLISFQLAALADWILSGQRPDLHDCVLPHTNLRRADIRAGNVIKRRWSAKRGGSPRQLSLPVTCQP